MSEVEKKVQPQVLVTLTTGDKVVFEIDTIRDFGELQRRMNEYSEDDFMSLGHSCIMRRCFVSSLYYLPEGFDTAKKVQLGAKDQINE